MTDAARLVDAYLQHCEDRELNEAERYLAPAARLEFPGGASYASLRAMVASPKAYNWVRKHRDRYVVSVDDELTTVVSIGRLYGERLDGTPFEGVRYVDVFTLRQDRIVEQLVWNDLPEAGLVPATT
ncbi:nuclear transport factor 2 family protein [Nocardioides carbamazepini]|uniref:nuclear transport factor 2 family protein n=1 Tax=Nocardioides carbamazepini TaxID=2854259 RepID=UPI002149C417|nr:nuclear transport factor 2 family protein [Nocardioides carbamazepini]MCR1783743.1 nuclear transport factor 2 family protein [Nocardioides carbamazepini]